MIGISFLIIGGLLTYFTYQIAEIPIDYTHCAKFDRSIDQDLDTTCAEELEKNVRAPCECRIPFNLRQSLEGEVLMYYELSNFYQNSRRYVSSRDDEQLFGQIPDNSPSLDCAPFDKRNDVQFVPCGSIANSLFNDTIRIRPENQHFVDLKRTDIAWSADREIKFRNPVGEDGDTDLMTSEGIFFI